MKLKDRIKSYSFWVSLSSAIILLLRLLGEQFGFSIDESLFSDIFTTLCGILVILGIIAPPSAKSQTSTTVEDCETTTNSENENFETTNSEFLNSSQTNSETANNIETIIEEFENNFEATEVATTNAINETTILTETANEITTQESNNK